MHKKLFPALLIILATLALVSCASDKEEPDMPKISEDRIESIRSIEKLTDYDDYNIYSMEIKYDYDIDSITPMIDGEPDTQELMNLIIADALPGIDVDFKAPQFGCSAFTMPNGNGYIFGRNYDFKLDSSAMLVRCNPKNGYKSVAFAALDNIMADDPEASIEARAACLTTPYVCLDGINEKGVGIAVLTLPSEPTCQRTGKPVLATSILIRLVLDRAATTEEAIELISQYDVFCTSGRDYHFYITDASGDGRVIEFDPEQEVRPMVVTPMPAITNFFAMYIDKVKPNQHNGIYGAGKER